MIKISQITGKFAEDKDKARIIRIDHIGPSLSRKQPIILDFSGVEVATQSFVHAAISEPIRKFGSDAIRLLEFKSCSPSVKSVILTVIEYSIEAAEYE